MLCKDCKFFLPKAKCINNLEHINTGYCKHPTSIIRVRYHNGKIEYNTGEDMRKYHSCGDKAIFFVHKDDDVDINYEHMIKFCTSCKYYDEKNVIFTKHGNEIEYYKCKYPLFSNIDTFTNNFIYPDCRDMRYFSKCGIDGKYFESKFT